jgi:hypothetical protein
MFLRMGSRRAESTVKVRSREQKHAHVSIEAAHVCVYHVRMATLERRVQVLFDPERYALLEAEARASGISVGAYVREAVEQKLTTQQRRSAAILQDLFTRSDASKPVDPISVEDWYREYDDELALEHIA